MTKKSPYREDTGVPDTLLLPCCAHGNHVTLGVSVSSRVCAIFFRRNGSIGVAVSPMAGLVGRLKSDASARIAGDVASQVAARHGLPIVLRGGGSVRIAFLFPLSVRLPDVRIGMHGRHERQRNDNAACDEQ